VLIADQFDVARWAPRLRWTLARFAHAYFPGLAALALQMDAAGLEVSGPPELLTRELVQVPPELNEDLLDLFGRNGKLLRNHFTFLNRSRELPEDIDWEPDKTEAWRVELHAFDYGLDLALYFRISREERYARHLRYLLAHWTGANAPAQGSGWQLAPLARRLRNWILAADLARDDWMRDAVFFNLVAASLALQAAYLVRHASSARNADDALDCAIALELAGRFFGGAKGRALQARGESMLRAEVAESHSSLGEGDVRRPNSQLHLAQALVEHLIFHGGDEQGFWEEKLREVVNDLQGMLLPDGELPLFGPEPGSSVDNLEEVFAFAAVLLVDPVCKQLAGKFGLLPYMLLGERGLARFESLPEIGWKATTCLQPRSGLYRLIPSGMGVSPMSGESHGRDGRATNSSGMIINGRLPGRRRDHQDALSYELLLCGQRVIVDSGAYAPSDEAAGDYFSSARAHNVLLVDGQDPRYDARQEAAQISAFPNSAALSLPQDSGSDLEGNFGFELAHHGFDFLGVNHRRAWLSLGETAWAVVDRLEGASPHAFTSLIHFYPTFEIEVREDRAIARSRSLACSVIPIGGPPTGPNGSSNPKLHCSRGDDPDFPGWYAPEFGVKHPASVLRLDWPRAPLPRFGGYLIAPGASLEFTVDEVDDRSICFVLGGRRNRVVLEHVGPGLAPAS